MYLQFETEIRNRNLNRNLQTSKAPLKSQAQGTSLFTSAASNQRGFPKNSPWEAQVRLPEGERMRQIKSNQINSFNWQNTTTDTDAKVVYIIPKLLDGRRTK